MPAALNIQPVGYDPNVFSPQNSVRAAFDAWLSHFDYTTGSYDLKISYGKIPGGIESSVGYTGDTYVQVGSSAGKAVVQPVFGLNVTGRNGTTPATPALTFDINQVGSAGNQFSNLLREFEHALGVRSFRGTAPALPALPAATTVFDLNVAGTENTAQTRPPSLPLFFQGPNAVVAYQAAGGIGPLLLSNSDGSILAAAVNTVNASRFFAGAQQIQPIDLAMLRDAGLPALTDQELVEHQIARLYFATYGRVAIGTELAGSLRYYNAALAAGTPPTSILAIIGAALVSDPALASNLASLPADAFVRTVYQNTFGRDVDGQTLSAITQYLATAGTPGRGAVLLALTDTDEARGCLSANANVTYAGTVEAQTARLYDTAFGRAADPSGFTQYTSALINGFTLKQAAVSFLGSGEFATRYGASPSDQALVDGLYANTLGRAPDTAGEAQYLQALASGTFDRADLVVAFSESAEHIGVVAQRASAEDAAGLFVNTQPLLGVIPVLSGSTPYG